jgi:hypothetical protein
MIWYKAWLETRFGVAFMFVLFTFVFLVAGAGARLGAGVLPTNNAPMPEELQVADALSFAWIAAAISFAGTGIKTPSGGFQNIKGLHGSTLYTLSLPVSRLRLIVVRTVVGLLETVVVIVVFTQLAWWIFPKTGQNTMGEILAHLVVTVICASTFYFLSLFLGTFLDDALRLPAGMTVLALLFTLDVTKILPPYLNIFRPMGSGSPLNTHTIAWGTLGIALAASAILFVAAVKVVRTQEY